MLLVFSDLDKTNFTFLCSLPDAVYPDILKIALSNLLGTKENTKVISNAASKLKVEVKTMSAALDTISACFLNSAKRNLSSDDVTSSLTSAGVSDSLVSLLAVCYSENSELLLAAVRKNSIQIPEYKSFEWRLECQVGSRSLHHTVIPSVLTKWNISEPHSAKTNETYLDCDVNTLQHITDSLRAAQQELESFHARKICRNMDKMG